MEMTKSNFLSILCFVVIALLAISAFSSQVKATEPTNPQPADAMWFESELDALDVTLISDGYKFNLTVWLNASSASYAWQFKIYFNNTYLNASRAGYTGDGKSEFFAGLSTMPVSPVIDNNVGSVLFGETLVGEIERDPGYGSLAWIEFEVTNATMLQQLIDEVSHFEFDPSLTYTYYQTPNLEKVSPDMPPFELPIIPEFPTAITLLISMFCAAAVITLIKKKIR